MWANFHTHSNYCDGKGELEDYLSQCIDTGISILGFSSHAPLPFPCKWCMKADALPNYLKHVESLKNTSSIEVHKSLEIDYIPGVIAPTDFSEQLDYTIGSIHFVDQLLDGTPWEIDGSHDLFLRGFNEVFNTSSKDAIRRYFELTREMIIDHTPTIVGHLDKIKIQNHNNKFYTEEDSWYQQEIKKTIDTIAKAGCILEINTRGLYQKKSDTTYPSPWVIQYATQKHVPLTLSSDAHQPGDLVNQFSQTASMLKSLNVTTLTVLHNNKWKPFNFTENGITRY